MIGTMLNTFPIAATRNHIAVLGKTGSGKTWAVKTIVEGLLDDDRMASKQIVTEPSRGEVRASEDLFS